MNNIFRKAILSLAVVLPGLVCAQNLPRLRPIKPDTNNSSSEKNDVILSAMRDAFCIIHLEYQLQDTVNHSRFNAEGKEYFGFSEGLCIKTTDGWIARPDVVTPWLSSQIVDKYPEFTPVVSSASILAVGDSVFRTITYSPMHNQLPIEGSAYVSVMDASTFTSGLALEPFDKRAEGFLVWVSREGDSLSLAVHNHIITSDTDSRVVRIEGQLVPDKAIGGVFVKPTYPSAGTVQFVLIGLLEKGDDKWGVVLMSDSKPDPDLSESKPKLVPADGKKGQPRSPKGKNNKKSSK